MDEAMRLGVSMLLTVLLVLLVGFIGFHHLRVQGRKAADQADHGRAKAQRERDTLTVIEVPEGHNQAGSGGGAGGSGAGGTNLGGGRGYAQRVWIVDEKGLDAVKAHNSGAGGSGTGGSSNEDHSFYYNGKRYVPTGEPGIFRELPEEDVRPKTFIKGMPF